MGDAMSEIPDPVPRKGESFGVVAYRWIVLTALAVTLMAVKASYDKLDKTADTLGGVERSLTALNGRLDAQAERLSDHDRRIGRLETPYFSTPERKVAP